MPRFDSERVFFIFFRFFLLLRGWYTFILPIAFALSRTHTYKITQLKLYSHLSVYPEESGGRNILLSVPPQYPDNAHTITIDIFYRLWLSSCHISAVSALMAFTNADFFFLLRTLTICVSLCVKGYHAKS